MLSTSLTDKLKTTSQAEQAVIFYCTCAQKGNNFTSTKSSNNKIDYFEFYFSPKVVNFWSCFNSTVSCVSTRHSCGRSQTILNPIFWNLTRAVHFRVIWVVVINPHFSHLHGRLAQCSAELHFGFRFRTAAIIWCLTSFLCKLFPSINRTWPEF